MTLDTRIAAHINASPLLQSQREVVAACVDAWLARFSEERPQIVGVECPFFLKLAPKTLLVGVIDRVTSEDGFITGNEWKSKKAPRIKKDGQFYKGDTREEWAQTLADSPQCRIYALALARGALVRNHRGVTDLWEPKVHEPRIRVRAVNKPDEKQRASVWTADNDAPFAYTQELCEQTAATLIAKAESVRAMRRMLPTGPWAIPSSHCTNKWGRVCEYFEPYCKLGRPPYGSYKFDPADPGSAAIAHAGIDLSDPEVVIWSASSFEKAQQCDEAYRVLCTDGVVKEEGEALVIGALFHECLAMVGREIMLDKDSQAL